MLLAQHSLAASVVSGCFDDAWIYWVAPLAGAIVGGLLLRLYEAYGLRRVRKRTICQISRAFSLILPTHDAAGGPSQGWRHMPIRGRGHRPLPASRKGLSIQ